MQLLYSVTLLICWVTRARSRLNNGNQLPGFLPMDVLTDKHGQFFWLMQQGQDVEQWFYAQAIAKVTGGVVFPVVVTGVRVL